MSGGLPSASCTTNSVSSPAEGCIGCSTRFSGPTQLSTHRPQVSHLAPQIGECCLAESLDE